MIKKIINFCILFFILTCVINAQSFSQGLSFGPIMQMGGDSEGYLNLFVPEVALSLGYGIGFNNFGLNLIGFIGGGFSFYAKGDSSKDDAFFSEGMWFWNTGISAELYIFRALSLRAGIGIRNIEDIFYRASILPFFGEYIPDNDSTVVGLYFDYFPKNNSFGVGIQVTAMTTGDDKDMSFYQRASRYNDYELKLDGERLIIKRFNNNRRLKTLTVPTRIHGRDVGEIGNRAFANKGLTNVAVGGMSIGSQAFAENPITTINIGGMDNIADDAFPNNFSDVL